MENLDQLDKRRRFSYAQEAGVYDAKRWPAIWGRWYEEQQRRLLAKILDLSGIQFPTILDVASGTGRIGTYLAQRNCTIVETDICLEMLKKAREKSANGLGKSRNFLSSNCRYLPFKESSFDIVTAMRFLHLIPRNLRAPYLLEMIRVLKPGGLLIIEFDNAIFHYLGLLYKLMKLKPQSFRKGKGMVDWPHRLEKQIHRVFGEIEIVDKYGLYLPFAGRIVRKLTFMKQIFQKSTGCPFFTYLSEYILLVVRKTHADAHKSA